MKLPVRKILIVLFALVFVGSGIALGSSLIQYKITGDSYDNAQALVGMDQLTKPDGVTTVPPVPNSAPTPTPAPESEQTVPSITPEPTPTPPIDDFAAELAAIDFTPMYAVNEEAIGWIVIPGTDISYPLMRGTDNDYYLSHAWDRSASRLGAIFMDYRNYTDMQDFHTIIYGHRITDNSMFTSLKYYADWYHWYANPFVYIYSEGQVFRYVIFSAYETDSANGHSYRLGLDDAAGQQAFINYCVSSSVLDTGLVPQLGDHILTLSTCTNRGSSSDYRWVVHAYRNSDQ